MFAGDSMLPPEPAKAARWGPRVLCPYEENGEEPKRES